MCGGMMQKIEWRGEHIADLLQSRCTRKRCTT
jgi:hypothetical protein